MRKDRPLVRASEIGLWAFCHRAWWLAQVKQTPHRNPALLSHGERAHQQHGRALVTAQRLATVGRILLLLALVLAGATLALWFAS
ncbi:MAG: hypothetical protein DCC55_27820 [Chloroflexi bacterium]|nr:MAG: hypothetical protein DCC55_27820 [Chloroflexota bacterium]